GMSCLGEGGPPRLCWEEAAVPLEVIDQPGEFLSMRGFVKTLFLGHPETLPIVRDDLTRTVGEEARFVMTRRDYLEMIPPTASKGAALRVVADHLGVPLA